MYGLVAASVTPPAVASTNKVVTPALSERIDTLRVETLSIGFSVCSMAAVQVPVGPSDAAPSVAASEVPPSGVAAQPGPSQAVLEEHPLKTAAPTRAVAPSKERIFVWVMISAPLIAR